MTNTEPEYWLLDELITMPNRELAERTMTLLWDAHGVLNDAFLARLVAAVSLPTCNEWRATLPTLVADEMDRRGVEGYTMYNYHHPCGVVDHNVAAIRPKSL